MGTRLPLHPYIALDVEEIRGTPRQDREALLKGFIAHITRADVKKFQYNLIFNEFDPKVDNWVCPILNEQDCHKRPRLQALVNGIGERGSILLPTIGDLMGYRSKRTFSLIKQITDRLIPVLTIEHEKFPLMPLCGERADPEIFNAMVQNSMRNEIFLRKVMQNERSMERAL